MRGLTTKLVNMAMFPGHTSYDAAMFPELLWVPFKCGLEAHRVPIVVVPYARGSRLMLLYAHGNGSDIGDVYPLLVRVAASLRVHVVALEYPGYGAFVRGKGRASVELVDAGLEAAVNFVTTELQWPLRNVVLWGASIGTGPTTRFCRNRAVRFPSAPQPAGLVLQCPYLSIREAARVFVGPWVSRLVDPYWDVQKEVKEVNCPVLWIHGLKDTLFSAEGSKRMYDEHPGKKALHLSKNATHLDFDFMKDIVIPMGKFLTAHLTTAADERLPGLGHFLQLPHLVKWTNTPAAPYVKQQLHDRLYGTTVQDIIDGWEVPRTSGKSSDTSEDDDGSEALRSLDWSEDDEAATTAAEMPKAAAIESEPVKDPLLQWEAPLLDEVDLGKEGPPVKDADDGGRCNTSANSKEPRRCSALIPRGPQCCGPFHVLDFVQTCGSADKNTDNSEVSTTADAPETAVLPWEHLRRPAELRKYASRLISRTLRAMLRECPPLGELSVPLVRVERWVRRFLAVRVQHALGVHAVWRRRPESWEFYGLCVAGVLLRLADGRLLAQRTPLVLGNGRASSSWEEILASPEFLVQTLFSPTFEGIHMLSRSLVLALGTRRRPDEEAGGDSLWLLLRRRENGGRLWQQAAWNCSTPAAALATAPFDDDLDGQRGVYERSREYRVRVREMARQMTADFFGMSKRPFVEAFFAKLPPRSELIFGKWVESKAALFPFGWDQLLAALFDNEACWQEPRLAAARSFYTQQQRLPDERPPTWLVRNAKLFRCWRRTTPAATATFRGDATERIARLRELDELVQAGGLAATVEHVTAMLAESGLISSSECNYPAWMLAALRAEYHELWSANKELLAIATPEALGEFLKSPRFYSEPNLEWSTEQAFERTVNHFLPLLETRLLLASSQAKRFSDEEWFAAVAEDRRDYRRRLRKLDGGGGASTPSILSHRVTVNLFQQQSWFCHEFAALQLDALWRLTQEITTVRSNDNCSSDGRTNGDDGPTAETAAFLCNLSVATALTRRLLAIAKRQVEKCRLSPAAFALKAKKGHEHEHEHSLEHERSHSLDKEPSPSQCLVLSSVEDSLVRLLNELIYSIVTEKREAESEEDGGGSRRSSYDDPILRTRGLGYAEHLDGWNGGCDSLSRSCGLITSLESLLSLLFALTSSADEADEEREPTGGSLGGGLGVRRAECKRAMEDVPWLHPLNLELARCIDAEDYETLPRIQNPIIRRLRWAKLCRHGWWTSGARWVATSAAASR